MCGVEPLIPVDVDIRRCSLISLYKIVETLVYQLRQLQQLESLVGVDVGDRGDGMVKPYSLSVYLRQGLVCPHLHSHCRRHKRIPCLLVDIGIGAVFAHGIEIVVAGNDHLVIAVGVGIRIVLKVGFILIDTDKLAERLV